MTCTGLIFVQRLNILLFNVIDSIDILLTITKQILYTKELSTWLLEKENGPNIATGVLPLKY